MGITFFAAWLTTELAAWFLVFQVLITLGFVAAGALSEWTGWLGLAITLASWVRARVHRPQRAAHRAGVCRRVRRRAGSRLGGRLRSELGARHAALRVAAGRAAVLVPARRSRAHARHPLRRRRRQAPPPRHLQARRRGPGRAGVAADPRRRVGDRREGATRPAAHVPPRRTRLGLRRDQLPALAEGHVAGPVARLPGCARMGTRQHRSIRRRPELRRRHRRFSRRPLDGISPH